MPCNVVSYILPTPTGQRRRRPEGKNGISRNPIMRFLEMEFPGMASTVGVARILVQYLGQNNPKFKEK